MFRNNIRLVIRLSTMNNRKMMLNAHNRLYSGSQYMANMDRVAVSNMCSTNNIHGNLEQVTDIVKRAYKRGCVMVFLPDSCDFIATSRAEAFQLAQPLSGNIVQTYVQLAKKHEIWISVGGIHEAMVDDGVCSRIFKTHLIINEKGSIVGLYRKIHLFDYQIGALNCMETEMLEPGYEVTEPIPTIIGPMGLQICYDIRFPEVASLLCVMGAKILVYPAAQSYAAPALHWHLLAMARAVEQQCFIIAATQVATCIDTPYILNNSVIIDPTGNVVAKCLPNERVAIGHIDLSLVDTVRSITPRLEHRRWDIYSINYKGKYTQKIKFDHSKSIEHYAFIRLDGTFKFGHGAVPMSTIFCHSAFAVAFTNIRCVVPGHVLVATKRSVARLKDMEVNESVDFFMLVSRVQRIIEFVYNAAAMTVTIQDGEEAGQTVRHVHCHIMPRRRNDFAHNDLIYVELNRHDAMGPAGDAGYNRRTLNEMSVEAIQYLELSDFF